MLFVSFGVVVVAVVVAVAVAVAVAVVVVVVAAVVVLSFLLITNQTSFHSFRTAISTGKG